MNCYLAFFTLLLCRIAQCGLAAKQISHLSSDSVLSRNVMEDFNEYSLMPRIPKCYDDNKAVSKTNCLPKLKKKTSEKFLLCSSFRNEEGFLAEFVSYYNLHGFDRMILYDFNSTDKYMNEIKPWVMNNFVEIRNVTKCIDMKDLKVDSGREHHMFYKTRAINREIEKQCMSYGISNGYDYYTFVSVDEYILPTNNQVQEDVHNDGNSNIHGWDYKDTDPSPPFISIADVVHDAFNSDIAPTVPRLWMSINTYSYSPSPHLLEPLDLLTIEAFQVRYLDANRMNFDMSVMPKKLYKISGHELKNARNPEDVTEIVDKFPQVSHIRENKDKQYSSTQLWLINCCHVHGCDFPDDKNDVCYQLSMLQKGLFDSRNLQTDKYWLRNNHYTRSLEKFQLKQGHWQTHKSVDNPWNIRQFLQSSYGWHYDPVAIIYSCLIRYDIYQMYRSYYKGYDKKSILATGVILSEETRKKAKNGIVPATIASYYFERSGADWYRNPEYIRIIEDLSRRGRGTGGAAEYIHTPYNPTMVSSLYASNDNQFVTYYDHITSAHC